MNAKTNYTMVGLFVVFSVIAIFVFVIWLIRPTDKEALVNYEIYFTESVSGLNIDSPVKYRGVTIGKVISMEINDDNVEEIVVDISVKKSAPIKIDTVATLKSQGITGLNYIDLSKGSREAERLIALDGEVAEIDSAPSLLVKLQEQVGSVSDNLSKTLHATQVLLREENQEEITRVIAHLANTLEKIDHAMTKESTQDFQRLLHSTNATFEKIDKTMPKIDALIERTMLFEQRFEDVLQSYAKNIDKVGQSMQVFEERNANGDYSVKEGVQEPMKEFGITMREMQATLNEINQLLSRYSDSPSDLFFKSEEEDLGPGEK